ncbi:MAG: VOC family protein [Lachnospiraceae bacterium]|nr:VOC family protein [Lachnospiraceae bacterium]
MILGIDHVDFRVPDVDAAIRFYCEGLGLTLVRRDDSNGIAITPDGVILEISPEGSDQGDKSGITHVCYNTWDVDKTFERALEYGAVPSRESDPLPYTYKNLRMAFVRTPSGEEIEFWSIRRPDRDFGEPIPGNCYIKHFVHVAMTVPDMYACVRFYEGLGARLKTDWEWGCSMALPDGREFELFSGGEVLIGKQESYTHMCLLTEDVDAELERITALGGHVAHEPYDWSNLRIAFAVGLAGEVIELFQFYDDGRIPDVFVKPPTALPDLFAEESGEGAYE